MQQSWNALGVLLLLLQFGAVNSLECMQCDKNNGWYSEEEHERSMSNCQQGLVAPTVCENKSHTHCIVSWYTRGVSSERVITERKCGTADDVTGCTLYNSNIRRRMRHLISNDASGGGRAEANSLPFVQVCSEACPKGHCVNSTPDRLGLSSVVSLCLMLLLRIVL